MISKNDRKINNQKFFGILPVFLALLFSASVNATTVTCFSGPCSDSVTLQANVHETLSVSISTPESWASGDIDSSDGKFLRNKIGLSVVSNNGYGFVASMTSGTDSTSLANTVGRSTIPTLTSGTYRNEFPVNYWGYSVNDTDDGAETSEYAPLVAQNSTSPIELIRTYAAGPASQDIYFGAKADTTLDSGTYRGTVVISVVTGVIDVDNPVTPEEPIVPNDPGDENPSYNNGYTVYTYGGTNATTTEINEGDARDAYSEPAGVIDSIDFNIVEGTPLATGLAIAAAVAAVTGIIFLIATKRSDKENS